MGVFRGVFSPDVLAMGERNSEGKHIVVECQRVQVFIRNLPVGRPGDATCRRLGEPKI